MLPCQAECSSYQSGCHKNCPRWQAFQQHQQQERQKKKDYLRYYNELCATVTRQYAALGYSIG